MRLRLPFTEAVAIAEVAGGLPSVIASLDCSGSTIQAQLDLRELQIDSAATRLALSLAGTVTMTATLDGFTGGVATFAVTVHVRHIPAHRLIPLLLGPIEASIVRAEIPTGVVTVESGDTNPVVRVDVQRAVDARVRGLTVTGLDLEDAVIHFDADLSGLRRI